MSVGPVFHARSGDIKAETRCTGGLKGESAVLRRFQVPALGRRSVGSVLTDVGPAGCARAAVIAGCVGTSNVLTGAMFGVPVLGTHAHSWIMSFPNEERAFRTPES